MRDAMHVYFPLSDRTWMHLTQICRLLSLSKGEFYLRQGQLPHAIAFVDKGVLRAFTTDAAGTEYNKIFFTEGSFAGSMAALLTDSPSAFAIECLEDCRLLEIDHAAYRQLLYECDDLKLYHIHYLEKNWLLDKEKREVALVQDDATARYLAFLENHPGLEGRLAQYHIASHLGITPTQLSRIRKGLLVDN